MSRQRHAGMYRVLPPSPASGAGLGACPMNQVPAAPIGQVDAIVMGGRGRGGGGRGGFPVRRAFFQQSLYPYPVYEPVYVTPTAPAGCVGPVTECPAGMAWARNAAGYLCCTPTTLATKAPKPIVMGPVVIVGSPGACATSDQCPTGYYCNNRRCVLDVASQVI